MKFELTDQDRSYIDKINNDKNNEIPLFVNELGKEYYFTFVPVDLAKANCFAASLMNPNHDFIKMMEEECGIKVTAISYVNPAHKATDTIIEVLEDALRKLKGES